MKPDEKPNLLPGNAKSLEFGRTVQRTRREYDLTPRAAAERVELTIEDLRAIERGERRPLNEASFLNALRGARIVPNIWRGEDE